jgi:CTP synthase (UTP-ammonia lyase)
MAKAKEKTVEEKAKRGRPRGVSPEALTCVYTVKVDKATHDAIANRVDVREAVRETLRRFATP